MASQGLFLWPIGIVSNMLAFMIAALLPSQPVLKPMQPPDDTNQQQKSAMGRLPNGAIARLGDIRFRYPSAPICVLFSPNGQRVFSSCKDGVLQVWDVGSGAAIDTLSIHQTPHTPIRLTHDGSKLVVACSDGRLRFFNPITLKQISAFNTPVDSDFAISADNSLLATNTVSNLIVTELDSEEPKLELPVGSQFAFHPDSKSIAVADPTGQVTLYMLAGGKPTFTFSHGQPLNGLIFSPDGRRIATGGNRDGEELKIWEIGNDKPVAEIKGASKPQSWIGNNKIAAANGSAVGVYDLVAKKWTGFAQGISGEWAVSPDGTKISATGSGGLNIRIWDLATSRQLYTETVSFPDTTLLAPTRDGQAIFTLSGNNAFLWPISKTSATHVGTLPGKSLAASSGGDRLAVAVREGVLIYDRFGPAKPLPDRPSRILTSFGTDCKSVALSLDGRTVAYTGDGVRVVIADASDGNIIRILRIQTLGLGLAFTPDGEKLAIVGRDGFLRLCSVNAPTSSRIDELWSIPIQRGPRGAVAVSPDGKRIAASSSTQLVVVSAIDGSIIFTQSSRNSDDGPFQQLAFSRDGRLLFSGSAGSTGAVVVWETLTHTFVHRYTTGFGAINCLGVSTDGLRVVSTGADEALTLWDLSFRKGNGPPTATELSEAWQNLDSLDGRKGYPAVRALTAGGASGVNVIAKGLQEMLDAQKEIAGLVMELGSENFSTRESATKKLLAHGIRALPAVSHAAISAESPETRKRANEILDKLAANGVRIPDDGLVGDTLRMVRAVQVLENVGGSDATKLLGQVAILGGRAGNDAKGAIKRLDKR